MFQPAEDFNDSSNRILENHVYKFLSDKDAAVLPPLRVSAEDGTVTLRGLVDSHLTRRAILAIVRQVPSVARVIDDMEVPLAAKPSAPTRARYEFSPALTRFFEERRQGLVSDSPII